MITKIAEKITFNVGDDDNKNKTPWGSIAMGGAGLAGLGYLGYNKFWKPRAEANAALDAYKKMTTKGGSKWLGRGIKGLGALGALGGIGLMGYNYANGNDVLDFSPVTNAWNSMTSSGTMGDAATNAVDTATQNMVQPYYHNAISGTGTAVDAISPTSVINTPTNNIAPEPTMYPTTTPPTPTVSTPLNMQSLYTPPSPVSTTAPKPSPNPWMNRRDMV